jgi:hypothetical protein
LFAAVDGAFGGGICLCAGLTEEQQDALGGSEISDGLEDV